ncbi:MAG: hypothetical protein ACXW2Q_05270 [Thermoanaerobaculia bacterium]
MKDAARRRSLLLFLAGLIFLGVRLAILYARAPFFDELFTVWMARQPLRSIAPALLHDSGPPLYYFIARFDSVVALRLLSLLFASIQFVLIARRSLLAGALIALYPPAALFAVDARSYALCALFVTIGVLQLETRPFAAALAFALAAHTHYYGVLFFPVLLFRPRASRVAAFALAVVLFLPGFFLASKQPRDATKWIHETMFAPLMNISFAGLYPEALFAPPPVALVVFALVVLVIALWRSTRFAAAAIVPLALVIAFHLAGRPVYFPMRFESVIAGALVLWLGESLCSWALPWRRLLAGTLLVIGAISIAIGVDSHRRRALDPYREAALMLRRHVQPDERVVATGYLYLEAAVALNRPVLAWPPEQADHPGWRAVGRPDPHALPPGPFIWIGESAGPELSLLQGVRPVQPLFSNDRATIARVGGLTPRLN